MAFPSEGKPLTLQRPTRETFVQLAIVLSAIGLLTAHGYREWWPTPRIYMALFADFDYWALLVMCMLFLLCMRTHFKIGQWMWNFFHHTKTLGVITFMGLSIMHFWSYKGYPLSMDEYCFVFQSQIFAQGEMTGHWPLGLHEHLVHAEFMPRFLTGMPNGDVFSRYWPGYSLLLAPFTALQAPWLLNVVLAVACLFLVKHLCQQLFPDHPQAYVWGTIFLLTSPSFLVNAVTFYPNTFYVFSSLAFVALILHPHTLRLIAAGLLGAIAINQHQPMPHFFFVLPWFVWLLQQKEGWRKVLILTASYIPLGLFIGLGWIFWMIHIGAPTHVGTPMNSVMDYLTGYHTQLSAWDRIVARYVGLLKLWAWTTPGLVLLAFWGFRQAARQSPIKYFGYSAITMFLGYLFAQYDGGHGWGFRYFEGAWGGLVILGVAAMSAPAQTSNSQNTSPFHQNVLFLCTVGMLLFVPLRFAQVEHHLHQHLERHPQFQDNPHLEIGFVETPRVYHRSSPDLIQNHAFLTSPKIIFQGNGPAQNHLFMKKHLPNFVPRFGESQIYVLGPEHMKKNTQLSPLEEFLVKRTQNAIDAISSLPTDP